MLQDPIDRSLKEALLAYEKIDEKHTGENIQNAIEQIIGKFQLKQNYLLLPLIMILM
ncbi:7267_t:CDS:2 [Funneliformis geosporum]|uniref:7267_t:CDS:1 n=1 Tax=Funneliformis geosporum TaxID=1117311 RepID=A0A9W4WL67_9GLOM|nr:7267_t:CDS:2 [Funneliformis geosporum]